jgi:hypothetical protein
MGGMWNFSSKPDGILCNNLELKVLNKILTYFTPSVFLKLAQEAIKD